MSDELAFGIPIWFAIVTWLTALVCEGRRRRSRKDE